MDPQARLRKIRKLWKELDQLLADQTARLPPLENLALLGALDLLKAAERELMIRFTQTK